VRLDTEEVVSIRGMNEDEVDRFRQLDFTRERAEVRASEARGAKKARHLRAVDTEVGSAAGKVADLNPLPRQLDEEQD
jgi:hypothetical protein